jgi:hypothetical protein
VDGLALTLTLITVIVAVVNVGWTITSQTRDRKRRAEEREADRRAREKEREQDRLERERQWRFQGGVPEISSSGLFEADRTEYSVVEVRNVGRGPVTVGEIGSTFLPAGPTYVYYSSEEESGYPMEAFGQPLPYVLEGGRRAAWRMRAEILRRPVTQQERWDALRVYVKLETGERLLALPAINPPKFA